MSPEINESVSMEELEELLLETRILLEVVMDRLTQRGFFQDGEIDQLYEQKAAELEESETA